MVARGFTQAALAAKSSIAQTTISLYLRPGARGDTTTGRAGSPTLANVEALAAALGVEVWELLMPINIAERELFRAVTKLAASVHPPPTQLPARPADHPASRPAAQEPQEVTRAVWKENKLARDAIQAQWDQWENQHKVASRKRQKVDDH